MFVKNYYEKKELLQSSNGELFGESGPKLPAPNMLMIDSIKSISKTGGRFNKGYVEANFNIKPDLWFFKCHFIKDPVMPGCLGLDAMWQLVGFYLGWIGATGNGRALGVGEVRFSGQILPISKQVCYNIHIKRVIKRNLVIGIADGEVLVDSRLIYIATDLKVGLFKKLDLF